MLMNNLTPKQKVILRAIAEGLENGSVKTIWNRYHTLGNKFNLIGFDRAKELGMEESDLIQFIKLGFISQGEKGYYLDEQLILDVVNNDFEKPEAEPKFTSEQNFNTHSATLDNAGEIMASIFGKPSDNPQFSCDVFMIMPFANEYTAVFEDVIKPLIIEMGYIIKRGDNFFTNHEIMFEIWSAIYYSKFVIADCSSRNPNVFYELGIAHTLNKPTIMITQSEEDVPFDVRGKRFILYKNESSGFPLLKDDLSNAIKLMLTNETDTKD